MELTESFTALPGEAEITGFERHLTVTTRTDGNRVDLWFSLKRGGNGADWDAAFSAVTAAGGSWRSGVRSIQVSPFTPARGWIVARGVDLSRMGDEAVEALVRDLVQRVNAVVAQEQVVSEQSGSPVFPGRLRAFLGEIGTMSRSLSAQAIAGTAKPVSE